MNRTIVLSSIAIISLLAFVAANRADKVVTLEDRVKDLEDRIANLEQSMFATATLSVMDAERRLDQAKTAVRESQKLHNRGILNTSRLDQDRFELERSHDNETFELIGTIEGSGNSQSTLQYAFTDVRPFNGDNYYRLKQVDHNGDFEYFDVVSAYIKKEKKSSLRLIPNPTGPGSVLQIEANGLASNSGALIEVHTSSGEVVLFDHAHTDPEGNLSKQMSVTLKQGLYIVTVASEGEGISSQLVVR